MYQSERLYHGEDAVVSLWREERTWNLRPIKEGTDARFVEVEGRLQR